MFDHTDEPINEPEESVPDAIDTAPVESMEPLEPREEFEAIAAVEAAAESGIYEGPNTPALGERETQRLATMVERVDELSDAIAQYPNSPANYVLRGEMFLEGGDRDLAADDFEHAIRLADEQAESANWGYIYRALADRAREGLRRV